MTLAFSPDGHTIAMHLPRGLAFFDVRTGERKGSVSAIPDSDQILFSPRGDVAASIGGDRSVQLLDVATSARLGVPFAGGASYFKSAAFDASGTVIHTVDDAGVLRDVLVDPGRIAATVCARVGQTLTPAEWERHLPGLPYRDPCP
ncbi:hypothetical protein [Sphaerisporangium sp. TRM90804]|uniref:hypothetical protein n=1 Tax=Sphaerisporangium sp. TRM90804 TaxID=3031113 RepID=UPI002446C170|nr:hypothetical protein [Sphaerisporangium sp. TRM90804]MDH2426836.1 hypothetical protein [Sphaerisporangium sp. TRM90804]